MPPPHLMTRLRLAFTATNSWECGVDMIAFSESAERKAVQGAIPRSPASRHPPLLSPCSGSQGSQAATSYVKSG